MCGVGGFLSGAGPQSGGDRILNDIGQQLRRRGPDAQGTWISADRVVGFVHTRLAIIDLSSSGNQPITSACGRFTISFNGEIYNYIELREEIFRTAGSASLSSWQGTSDTEVFVNAVAVWGLEVALNKARGMFAAAIWDSQERVLFLARDRFGEKPLVYATAGSAVVFASYVTALRAHPDFEGEISRSGLRSFLSNGYVSPNQSIFTGVKKVPPGAYVRVDENLRFELHSYWEVDRFTRCENDVQSAQEWESHLHDLLLNVTAEQIRADTSVGCFLSGGTDSSLLACLARDVSDKPINSFTIGFDAPEWDETPTAEAIAKILGLKHHTKMVTKSDLLSMVDSIPDAFDEPFADPSQIPTLLLAQFTKNTVKTCLSGDGADEIFHGYDRYELIARAWQVYSATPRGLRSLSHGTLKNLISLADAIGGNAFTMNRGKWRHRLARLKDRGRKVLPIFDAHNFEEFYFAVLSVFPQASDSYTETLPPRTNQNHVSYEELFNAQSRLDLERYLPGNILVKVDRASMYHSLETRSPYLDHRVFEASVSIPASLKRTSKSHGKVILKNLLGKYLPSDIIHQKKKGFGVPLADWLRNDLRNWAGDSLHSQHFNELDIIEHRDIQKIWREHQDGLYDWHRKLWTLLMFYEWHRHQKLSPLNH